jgi:hypothetical protein
MTQCTTPQLDSAFTVCDVEDSFHVAKSSVVKKCVAYQMSLCQASRIRSNARTEAANIECRNGEKERPNPLCKSG